MNDNPWKAMGLVSAVGIDLAGCMWAGYFFGTLLDKHAGTDLVWSLVGLAAGLIIGIFTVILLIKRFTGDENTK
jgi:ATP synthase protein I